MNANVLLFVANYPSDTGYAWATIERVLGLVAARLAPLGVQSLIAYPRLVGRPASLDGLPIEPLVGPFGEGARSGNLQEELRFLGRHRVRTLYLTDRRTRSLRYLRYRQSGVRRIVVHDRTSGERSVRGRAALFAKRVAHRVPGYAADCFIGVSEFVRQRLITVNGTPPEHTYTVYNGVDLDRFCHPGGQPLYEVLGLQQGTPLVFTASRANAYKGIPTLLEAAAQLERNSPQVAHVVYAGDGPDLPAFRQRAAELGLTRFHFLGKRTDVPTLLASASVAAVPSLWAEAFGLSVVEAMAAGVPLVASAIGGIPELVEDGVTGLLVPPGDPAALAAAIRQLLDDSALRARLSAAAQASARTRFGLDRVADELAAVLRPLLPQPTPR